MNQIRRYRPLGLLIACCLTLFSVPALADLMINPTRVVFEKNQRAASIDLINDGTKPASYRVNLVNRRMSEDGQFSRVEQAVPGEQFADSMVVFSPRQFTIPAGGSQVVRIAVRKPAGLAAGEYRSHLSFDRLPDADEATNIENVNKKLPPNEIGVQITALIGVSIPVIVREGNTRAEVAISGVELRKPANAGQPPMLALQLNRSGNSSVYGDIVVNFTPAGGTATVVGRVSGLAVYTPNPLRRATINLQVPPGTSLQNGKLSVLFQERADAGGKQLAEASIAIP
ncbi:fimbrial biogenesis chaperone [Lacisediminimonas profundi]|uniref:fimbrial biogenesis chaperone n=1 Tax=Lacisediminimonas profundi TaxID=2603856 RepID=UPI0013874155|nr:fimbria/pilus periplasmic chaperone [Lacisediminimonas profundi]